MDLRLVEYFLAVVDHGGTTRAAQELYIAQPSLSQAIRTLERQLGVTLFDRSGRHLVLTPDGEAFTAPARRILADADRARSRVRSVRDLASGRLEIAAVSTLTVDPLPELTSALHGTYPGVRVTVLDPGSAAGVLGAVRRGHAELGLVDRPVPDDTLQVRDLWTQEIALVLPPALAAELPDPVPLHSLAEVPLIVELSGSGSRAALEAELGEVVSQVGVECAHRQAIWELVVHGAGATLLPRRIAESELRDVVVRSVAPAIEHTLRVVHRTGPLSPAATAFLHQAELTRVGRSNPPTRRTPAPQATTPPDRRPGRTTG
ncbi:LysR family transcriptional regulator [Pseudonocardia nantongensis]|uniref:LysR family transcriptional regulator n=1 Tax=Pseudonocardia nantongensis TaxID=1181885 RepID=UPI00397B4175